MTRLCYTCTDIVEDNEAAACPHEWCTAKRDVIAERKREQGTRPPQPNQPIPHYYDDGGEA